MARTKPRPTLAEQLRELIADSELSNYELGRQANVAEASIWRFRKGERDLTLETAGRLCEVLGVEPLRVSRRSRPSPPPRADLSSRRQAPGVSSPRLGRGVDPVPPEVEEHGQLALEGDRDLGTLDMPGLSELVAQVDEDIAGVIEP